MKKIKNVKNVKKYFLKKQEIIKNMQNQNIKYK